MKLSGIDAIAFDIDGTLYPAWKFTIRCIPFFFQHIRFMHAFSKVRHFLHIYSAAQPDEVLKDFFGLQTALLSAYLHMPPAEINTFLNKEIYHGWQNTFLHLRPYPHVKEVIEQLKNAGFKIGILSDFPPEQKGTVWDILPLCDAAIGSESTGALKPSHIPFRRLSEALETPCSRILYVGNHQKYDVAGAASVGMKTAYIQSPLASIFNRKIPNADISFSNYRQLLKNVL